MYKVLDLFCGIGGFSKGFLYEGFDVVAGIDFRDVALKTFESSHKKSEAILADLTKLEDNFWEKYKGVNIIIAGPPCQGFSMAGKRTIGDKRNTLFAEVIRAAKIISPDVVIIENVVGLLSMKDENDELVKDVIERELSKLGYITQYKVLDASEYGVPQKRKRVIFIGTKNKGFEYPKTNSNIVTVGDALSNIPNSGINKYIKPKNDFQKLMAKENEKLEIYNHEKIEHKDLITRRMASIPQGGNRQDIPIELGQGGGKHSNNYRRLNESSPSITLKHATKSMIVHPNYDRGLTPREVARLQSFSDDFVLKGTKFEQHQQLANAVPPLLGKAIANSVKLYLKKEKDEKKI